MVALFISHKFVQKLRYASLYIFLLLLSRNLKILVTFSRMGYI
jgi:hypothetical protein